MSVPNQSLKRFLYSAKAHLKSAIANGGKVNLVVGNESADLDSINCALVYSYLHPSSHQSEPYEPWIPVINVPRQDIHIRPELLKLLPHANLEPSDLIPLDESSAELTKLKPENTRWILVDHNALLGPLSEKFSHRVVGCIDHHKDEQQIHPEAGEPHVIKNAGSCTSLVVNYLLNENRSASSNDDSSKTSGKEENWKHIAKIALSSVVVDTQDLTSKHKTTDDDYSATEFLEKRIQDSEANFDRHVFYKEINDAKSSLEDLSLDDILRKDYKQWEAGGRNLGVSSVVKSFSFLMDKAENEKSSDGDKNQYFRKVLRNFSEERDLDVLAIMAASTDPSENFQRELLVSIQKSGAKPLLKKFEKEGQDELQLKPLNDSSVNVQDDNTITWQQENLEKSRKRVGPLLRSALDDASETSSL